MCFHNFGNEYLKYCAQNANIYPIDIYCHYKNIIHTGENMTELSTFQYELLYNTFSFGIATFSCIHFLWLSQVSSAYKTAISLTGLVTFIAFYHYWRIFESFGAPIH